MKLAAARVTTVRLPLRSPLATAHGIVAWRDGVLLGLETDVDATGWGETLPLPGFGFEEHGATVRVLRAAITTLLGRDCSDPEPLLDEVRHITDAAPGACAALDLALHDLAAQAAGAPLSSWLAAREGRTSRTRVALAALVAGDEPQQAAEAAASAAMRGFRTLKLKLGDADFERDLERVRTVRDAIPEDLALRLDANGAWSEDEARERLEMLAPYDVEFLEQPVAAEQRAALARLHGESPIRLAADEAVCDEESAADLLAARAVDLLVVKPAAVGGLRAAQRIAARARSQGVDVIVTSFLDTGIGRSAALHFTASLPGEQLDAGLATGDLLIEDPVTPALHDAPEIHISDRAGLGLAADPQAVARFRTAEPFELRAG